jgi:epoxyqueuosine reductase
MSAGEEGARPDPTALVKALARDAGFDLVGIARATPLDPAALDAWLEAGFNGAMGWMASGRDARVDPRALLPSARSVVALAVNYYRPGETTLPGGGRISRYAWGRDYHKVLGGRLRALRRALGGAFPGARSWGGVDAVPIMEKAWAQRAGLGWIGKNGNLITRRYGSWVFLATLLVDLDLDPDPPHADHCGSCAACLPACPTGAIVSPGVVDSKRCLSYHTIEHRDRWPDGIAERSEGWMYGCDTCQDVCPWSAKFAVDCGEPDFAPRPAVMERPLSEWIRLDAEGFDRITRGSPMRRAGEVGLVRSAVAASPHAPGEDVAAAVSERAEDGREVIRWHALRALAMRKASRGGA